MEAYSSCTDFCNDLRFVDFQGRKPVVPKCCGLLIPCVVVVLTTGDETDIREVIAPALLNQEKRRAQKRKLEVRHNERRVKTEKSSGRRPS